MLICIPDVLSREEVAACRRLLDQADWIDGRLSAGTQSMLVKANEQLAFDNPVGRKIGEVILASLYNTPLFLSAAVPLRILPPMFNRYSNGGHFGIHVDNSIRYTAGSDARIRTDLSMTLFLTDPEDYDGGELTIETEYGAQQVKLPAGHMVLYPSTSLHQVMPVTRGMRVSSFFWLQSMIRDAGLRAMLFDLDQTIQQLTLERGGEDGAVIRLTGIYHNLMRQFAET